MEEWKEYTVSDVIEEISMGPFGSNIKVDNFIDFGVPVLNGSNLQGFKLNEESFNYVSQEKADSLGKANAHKGDVVITHRGTLGQIVYIPEDSKYEQYVISQSQFRLKLDRNLIRPDFFVYFFHTRLGQHRILMNASQVGVPALARPTSTFKKVLVPVPPIEVQSKIMDILSSLDDKIAINRRICENLEAQAQALFKHWFVDFAPFKNGKFVESELGMIPEGWRVGKLGDYCKVKSGFAFKSSWWTTEGCPVVKIKNITNSGRIDMTDCSFVSKQNTLKAEAFKANRGDLVIAMTGATIGKFNIIPQFHKETYINQRVGKFFLGDNPLNKLPYIYCLLSDNRKQLTTMGQGSAQPNISGSDIESIVAVYSNNVIDSFNEMCYPLFDMILTKQEESSRLSSLRDTLLPKLMSGEIKV